MNLREEVPESLGGQEVTMIETAEKKTYTTQKLAQMRDELKVKMHLAKAETRDQWARLDDKWHDLQRKMKTVENASAEAAEDLREGVRVLLRELGEGYDKIRRVL